MNRTIKSKEDYLYFLECDRIALRCKTKHPRFMTDEIRRLERLLRKREYYNNVLNNHGCGIIRMLRRIYSVLLQLRYKRLMLKYGFQIPLNAFGPGLSIAHFGTIVIAGEAKIGCNCRIHEGVTIGATNGTSSAAIVGDNVFIGTGAKIIGGVTISDNVTIAANAVVVKDIICDMGCTVGGVPAKIISSHNSSLNLVKATDLIK